MKILFERFLDDRVEYRAAEENWEKMFARLEHERGPSPKWEIWFKNEGVDGTPIQDGNPILSRVCHARSKAVRIIQHDPMVFSSEDFAAWISVFGEDPKYDVMLDDLAIASVTTEKSLSRAEELLRAYVVEDLDPKAMRKRFDFIGH